MKKSNTNIDKQLKDKAIKIKGNDYVLVADKVNYFNNVYTNGGITTEAKYYPEITTWVVKAIVFPDTKDQSRFFTGLSQANMNAGVINKTSALENAETSAVGRALSMMSIGVIESIASGDEINKAINAEIENNTGTSKQAGNNAYRLDKNGERYPIPGTVTINGAQYWYKEGISKKGPWAYLKDVNSEGDIPPLWHSTDEFRALIASWRTSFVHETENSNPMDTDGWGLQTRLGEYTGD